MSQNSKLTLAQLAKLAGVSTSTASRALNDNPLIKQQTRERIKALAEKHNFSLNRSASRLRTQRSNVIAVILNLTDSTEQSISDPFLLKIVGDLNQALNAKGFEMLLSNSLMARDNWANYFYRSQRADGLIVVGQGKSSDNIQAASDEGAPIIVWGDPCAESSYPTVGSNNEFGGYLATKRLLQAGAQRILFLGDPEHAEMAQRFRGYSKALQEAGIEPQPALTLAIDITSQAAYKGLNEFIVTNGLLFDGIFASSDMVALGALKALKERYINVPSDISLVGFDDISLAELLHPALTTIAQNTQQAAQIMVDKLIQRINNEPVSSTMLDIQLIERNSTK